MLDRKAEPLNAPDAKQHAHISDFTSIKLQKILFKGNNIQLCIAIFTNFVLKVKIFDRERLTSL